MRSLPVALEKAGIHRGLPITHTVTLSTGFAALDQRLDGGGWPSGELTELRLGRPGIGEMRLLMPMLAAVSQKAHVLWVAPPYRPYGPALVKHKMVVDHLLLIYPKTHKEALWAVAQGLVSPAIGVVVSWFPSIQEGEFRALQRQASGGRHWSFCFLPETLAPQPSYLRLGLRPAPGGLSVTVSRKAKRPIAPLVVAL